MCWASRPTRPGSPSGSSCATASDSLPKICRTTPTGSASPAPPSTSGKTCRSGRWRRRRPTKIPDKIHRPSWWAICSGPSSPAGRTRHPAQRRDPPHPGRTGSHPRPRRHPESLLSPQLPHQAQQGGIYREPERKQQCSLCSGASLLCAGDDPGVANPGINATIKDRYFNSACATPATAFPTLVKLAQKHLQKMSTPTRCISANSSPS